MFTRLACLDALATAATGRHTKVYLDDRFPPHLRGMAEYEPKGTYYVIRLNPALLTWLRSELEEVFYHEAAHIRLGHVPTNIPAKERAAGYRYVVHSKVLEGESIYKTNGEVWREEAADRCGQGLRARWPFACYPIWNLITGKETYP